MIIVSGLSIASIFGMFVLARIRTDQFATPPKPAQYRPVIDPLYFPE